MTISDECEDQLARLSWAKGVPAPMDADGEIVSLSVSELFADDGKKVCVDEIIFDGCWWYVKCLETSRLRLCRLHLSKHDSWERLLKDLERSTESGDKFYSMACAYVNNSGNTCGDCKFRGSCGWCTKGILEDIASRIRKLRGDAE